MAVIRVLGPQIRVVWYQNEPKPQIRLATDETLIHHGSE
jgi:hypothetical protein